MHFLYVFHSEKGPLHVSNRQAVHPQKALLVCIMHQQCLAASTMEVEFSIMLAARHR